MAYQVSASAAATEATKDSMSAATDSMSPAAAWMTALIQLYKLLNGMNNNQRPKEDNPEYLERLSRTLRSFMIDTENIKAPSEGLLDERARVQEVTEMIKSCLKRYEDALENKHTHQITMFMHDIRKPRKMKKALKLMQKEAITIDDRVKEIKDTAYFRCNKGRV